jgi:anaerobic selenocysteine-containing dehydrogenase
MEADAEVVRNGQPGVVKMGVAKKLEGRLEHPISQGGLCARGQAAIQITYHPDRIREPLKRSGARGEGRFQPITWDQALIELVARLDALEATNAQDALVFIVGSGRSARRALIDQFLERFGAPPPVSCEVFSDDVLRQANALSFGHRQLPTVDLAHARYALSFGTDILGTWNSPVAHSAAYGRMHQERPGVRGKFVQVEARMSQTGASADEWVPARPGTEGVLALGLANAIMAARLREAADAGQAGLLIEDWAAGLPAYGADRVEKITGVPARRIERMAREFAALQPAVAIIGGPPLAQTNALFSALAVNALNALAGSVGSPGGLTFMPQLADGIFGGADRSGSGAPHGLQRLAAGILAGESPTEVLLLEQTNPVFASPRAWRVNEALKEIPFIASFGNFLDETSILSDLILPDHSFLERWIDGLPESGAATTVANVTPPVMRPLHQTRSMPDVLLDVSRRLRRPLSPAFPWETFEDMLRTSYTPLSPGEGDEMNAWLAIQARGGWWGDPPATTPVATVRHDHPHVRVDFSEPRFDGNADQYPFHFLPFPSQGLLDGSLAHLPWLQELPDPLSSAMWSSWVEINPRTAERLGIAQGDVVEIISQHGSVRAAALVSPGIAPDVVAMPTGQGHRTFTRFASNRGANPLEILAPLTVADTGTLAWAATRVRISRTTDRDGGLILFAGAMREAPQHEGER